MKSGCVRSVWISAEDASFVANGRGQTIGLNASFPRDIEAFLSKGRENGFRFVTELTLENELLVAIVPANNLSPKEALKNGSGIVWGLTAEMAEQHAKALYDIVDEKERSDDD